MSAESIDDVAAEFAARLDRDRPLSAEEQATLDSWLSESSRHHGALVRAQAALVLLDGLRAPAKTHSPERKISRRALGGWGLATLAAGGAGVAVLGANRLVFETFSSKPGEIRRLSFPGGAEIILDARSTLRAAFSGTLQRVMLDSGRAFFELHNSTRTPLQIEAGDLQLAALQGAFSMDRHSDRVDLLVTDGSVDAWKHRSKARMRLDRGVQATLIKGALTSQTHVTPETLTRAASWTTGRLALQGETVAEAIAMFNRYNQIQIESRDADLNRQPLVGYFYLNDPEGFAASLEASFGVQAHTDAQVITLG